MPSRRVLLLGDVVGEAGLLALERLLPATISENKIDLVVANGENAADGFGLDEGGLNRILDAGVDLVSSGNHIWEKRDFWPRLDSDSRIVRPANYPACTNGTDESGSGCTLGRGLTRLVKNNIEYILINLQGRQFMTAIDCPFICLQNILQDIGPCGKDKILLLDFHAESTQEKEALALYADGRLSVVVGTHTHVPTADARILPQGTAYQTDLGMTGDVNSVIGMENDICVSRFKTAVPHKMTAARGQGSLNGLIVEVSIDTGLAVDVVPLVYKSFFDKGLPMKMPSNPR